MVIEDRNFFNLRQKPSVDLLNIVARQRPGLGRGERRAFA